MTVGTSDRNVSWRATTGVDTTSGGLLLILRAGVKLSTMHC